MPRRAARRTPVSHSGSARRRNETGGCPGGRAVVRFVPGFGDRNELGAEQAQSAVRLIDEPASRSVPAPGWHGKLGSHAGLFQSRRADSAGPHTARERRCMRTNPIRRVWLLASSLVLLCPVALWAQAHDRPGDDRRDESSLEEVVVRGQPLSELRTALEMARVRVYDLFNDLNSDDAFDVRCRHEAATGTRMRQHICRPQFKDDISNASARAW